MGMRLRSRAAKHKMYFWGLLGLAGTTILLVALPTWVLLALIGAGLVAGAIFGYKSGF